MKGMPHRDWGTDMWGMIVEAKLIEQNGMIDMV
jgi:hypothetical protein